MVGFIYVAVVRFWSSWYILCPGRYARVKKEWSSSFPIYYCNMLQWC